MYRVNFRTSSGKLFCQYLIERAADKVDAEGQGWRKLWRTHPDLNRRTIRASVEAVNGA